VVVIGYGAAHGNVGTDHVSGNVGKDIRNSCFGVVFHMIIKDLVIFGKPRPRKRRNWPKKS
jgi:hypothetical protein